MHIGNIILKGSMNDSYDYCRYDVIWADVT